MPTLRKWKGVVLCEEGNWIAARFEFLQGRSVAELHDSENVPWFDAAIVETEVWEALMSAGFHLDRLRELVEKLDRASILYAAVGDRSNAQFTADWAQWFKIFTDPSIPASDLVDRILGYVEGRTPRGEQRGEILMKQLPLRNNVFIWNYFWLARISQEIEAFLKNTFMTTASLEALARGAAVLATPPDDFKLLLQLDISRKHETPTPESQTQLLRRIESDLQHLRSVEKDAKEYVAEVGRQWSSCSPERRRDVIQAIYPGKWRR